MKTPNRRHLCAYVEKCLCWKGYLQAPGDGRVQPDISARVLLWAVLIGQILRECSFAAVEALAGGSGRAAADSSRTFSDDAWGYSTASVCLEHTLARLSQPTYPPHSLLPAFKAPPFSNLPKRLHR